MRIASSTVELAAAHASSSRTSRTEAFQAWVGDEPPRGAAVAPGRPALAAPLAAMAAAASPSAQPATPAADPTTTADEEGRQRGTPRDELDLAILRRTFRLERTLSRAAREIRSAYADPGPAQQAARLQAADRAPTAAPAQPPTPAGWGLRYDLTETSVQQEATTFSAAAQVTTGDGRTIQVQAALAMERTQVQTSQVQLRAGDAKVDPLVLNLQGGAASFSGTTRFDLNGDGTQETVAALGPGSAYLALDRNGNGTIDSGAELFGPSTGSGFAELSALDQDGNGWIDEGDAAFSQLQLWSPGSATPSPLQAAHVGAIYTGAVATPFDLTSAGGALQGSVAQTGLFLREDGTAGTVQHVDLVA